MLIEKVLKDFDIGKDNINSIVTDNASKMIKIIKNLMKVRKQTPVKKSLMIILFLTNEADQEQSDESLDYVVKEASKLCKIRLMQCAVYTLQLASRDGLKDCNAVNLIDKLR